MYPPQLCNPPLPHLICKYIRTILPPKQCEVLGFSLCETKNLQDILAVIGSTFGSGENNGKNKLSIMDLVGNIMGLGLRAEKPTK